LFHNKLLPIRLKVNENYSPLPLKENTRLHVPIIIYLPFIIGYALWGSHPHDIPVVGGFFPSPTPAGTLTIQEVRGLIYGTVTNTPIYTPAYVLPSTILPPTEQVTSTPDILSGFPFITSYGDYYKHGQQVLFSYYYPPLGGTNCHPDNWVGGHCKNTTASGEGWLQYMGRGIAIHPDMLYLYPFGSQIYVVNPPSIRGLYTVIDICNGCLLRGHYYFDFLFEKMPAGLNWSVQIDYLPYRIGFDGSFPPTSTLSVVYPTDTRYPTYTPTATNTIYPTTTDILPTGSPTNTIIPSPTVAATMVSETPTP
jgi:hypothetical protein